MTTPRPERGEAAGHVFQLLIVLPATEPLVWRRIQVPEAYTFWDLHVAIQDAMGWKDYHLHEFVLIDARSGRVVRIGIPDPEMPPERECLAGWEVPMTRYLDYGRGPARYLYDFGDDWAHTVDFEDAVPDDGGAYPRCVDGAGACPPEDAGGTGGYARFLRAIGDPAHPEHDAMLEWAGERFDPHAFSPRSVVFDDPRERWKSAFGGRGDPGRGRR